ncbi:MAG TPA: hypothetical protein VFG30_05820 [Polyangiales bacterium]|nr:hypothetical protein [Polyangiales bacterium]
MQLLIDLGAILLVALVFHIASRPRGLPFDGPVPEDFDDVEP